MTGPTDMRMTPATRVILLLLLQNPRREWRSDDIASRLKFQAGSTRAVLVRLEQHGWATRRVDNGRIHYRLTHDGAIRAQVTLKAGLTPTFATLARSLKLSTKILAAAITIADSPPPADPKLNDQRVRDEHRIARVLGAHLRTLRKERRRTRRQVVERLLALLGLDLSIQILATWELGTRHLTVIRLIQLCRVLDVPAREVIAHVEQTLAPPTDLACLPPSGQGT